MGLFGPTGTRDVLLASRRMELTTGQPIGEAFDGRWLMVTEGRGGFPPDIADLDELDAGPDEVLMNLPVQLW